MKSITKRFGTLAALVLSSSVFLYSCMPVGGGPTGKPTRKKMLGTDGSPGAYDSYGLAGFEPSANRADQLQYPAPPFSLADTVINFGSTQSNFYLIKVPSDNMDFLLPLAKAYEPYLTSWMRNWAQTGRTGMAIDLSSGNATNQSFYKIENPALQVSVPLIIFYDRASQERATNLTKFIQSLSTVHATAL